MSRRPPAVGGHELVALSVWWVPGVPPLSPPLFLLDLLLNLFVLLVINLNVLFFFLRLLLLLLDPRSPWWRTWSPS